MKRWITDWQRCERLPYYTRANAGEVLPEPASPLGWTLVFEQGLLQGWLRGFVGVRHLPRGASCPSDRPPVAGLFGGYFYINLSHMRLMGMRMGADGGRSSTRPSSGSAIRRAAVPAAPGRPGRGAARRRRAQTIGGCSAAACSRRSTRTGTGCATCAARGPTCAAVRRRTGGARPVVPGRAGQRVQPGTTTRRCLAPSARRCSAPLCASVGRPDDAARPHLRARRRRLGVAPRRGCGTLSRAVRGLGGADRAVRPGSGRGGAGARAGRPGT